MKTCWKMFKMILSLECMEMYKHTHEIKKYINLMVAWVSDFVLPGVWVGIGETIGEEDEGGWQPISDKSLQQSL